MHKPQPFNYPAHIDERQQGIALILTLIVLLITASLVIVALRGSITHIQLNQAHNEQIAAHQATEKFMLDLLEVLNNQIQTKGWLSQCSLSQLSSEFCIQSATHNDQEQQYLHLPALYLPSQHLWRADLAPVESSQRLLKMELKAFSLKDTAQLDVTQRTDEQMLAGVAVAVRFPHTLSCDEYIQDAKDKEIHEGLIGGVLNTLLPGAGGLANLDGMDTLRVLVGSIAEIEAMAGLMEVKSLFSMLSSGELGLQPYLSLDTDVLDMLGVSACVAANLQLNKEGLELELNASLLAGLNIPVLSPLLTPLLDGILSPFGALTGKLTLLGSDQIIALDLGLLSDITILDPLIQALPLLNTLGISQEGSGLVGQLLSEGTLIGDLLSILGVAIEIDEESGQEYLIDSWVDLNTSVLPPLSDS